MDRRDTVLGIVMTLAVVFLGLGRALLRWVVAAWLRGWHSDRGWR